MIDRLGSWLLGDFKGDESKKFFYLALAAFCLIGAQWPVKILRDSIFLNTVGSAMQPTAKMFSLVFCFPLTIFYTALVTMLPREKTLYFLTGVFGVCGAVFTGLLMMWSNGSIANEWMLGWAFYMFAESFSSLTIAPFWAFINDITYPGEAKRGYGMIVFGSQLGGFVLTLIGNLISRSNTTYNQQLPFIMGMSFIMLPLFAYFVWKTMHAVRGQNLTGYTTLEPKKTEKKEKKKKPSFWVGLQLILTKPYVFGIFTLTAFNEIIQTMMTYRLLRVIDVHCISKASKNLFLFNYALGMQLIAVVFALRGTAYFQQKMGIRFSLVAYPVFLGFGVAGMFLFGNPLIVAGIVASAKALYYALNKPVREVLYIPTSKDIKYKSKAWTEVFGIRAAKMSGSWFNKFAGDMLGVVAGTGFIVIGLWFFVAGKVGAVYHRIVEEREILG